MSLSLNAPLFGKATPVIDPSISEGLRADTPAKARPETIEKAFQNPRVKKLLNDDRFPDGTEVRYSRTSRMYDFSLDKVTITVPGREEPVAVKTRDYGYFANYEPRLIRLTLEAALKQLG